MNKIILKFKSDNARRWKHLFGGRIIVKGQTGFKTFVDSASDKFWKFGINIEPGVRYGIGKPFEYYDRVYLRKKGGKFISKYLKGNKITPKEYEPDWSDKVEPYAAGLGLAGDAVGLGVAATGVGVPIGATVATISNIPNLLIDGYLFGRDSWRAYNDNGNSIGSAAINAGELLLDVTGLKLLSSINKAKKAGVASKALLTGIEKKATSAYGRVGTGVGRSMARRAAERKALYNAERRAVLRESNNILAKRGVRPVQGSYYEQKLIEEMAKRGYGISTNDAIQSANRTLRQNMGFLYGTDALVNVSHLKNKKSRTSE